MTAQGVTTGDPGKLSLTGGTMTGPLVLEDASPAASEDYTTTHIAGTVLKSTVTTKGDLLAATGSATITRIGVGANGQVLTADSTAGTGLKWETPAGGGGGGAVDSVNDQVGIVVLTAADVGADAAGAAATARTTAEAYTDASITSLALGSASTRSAGDFDAAGSATTAASSSVAKSTLTTKGDLIAATGSAVPARLGVGSNGAVLTADSSQTTGLKWASGSGSPQLDPRAARLGLVAMSFDPEVCVGSGAPLNAGVFVVEPVYLFGTALTALGCWLVTEGITATGVNKMSVYSVAGGTATLVDSTVDMSTPFTAAGQTHINGNLAAGAYTPTPGIYLFSILTNCSTHPIVGGTGGLPNVPVIDNESAGGFLTGLSAPPASFSLSSLNANNGGYFMTGK